jgi:hypothetical protein
MTMNTTTPSQPGVIDRIRDLIAKVFGLTGGKSKSLEPVAAPGADGRNVGRPAEPTMLATESGRSLATA